MSDEQQQKIVSQYEQQIRDINGMLSETWEDKAKLCAGA